MRRSLCASAVWLRQEEASGVNVRRRSDKGPAACFAAPFSTLLPLAILEGSADPLEWLF